MLLLALLLITIILTKIYGEEINVGKTKITQKNVS